MKAGAIIALSIAGGAAVAGTSYYLWAKNQLDFAVTGVDLTPPAGGIIVAKVRFLIKNGTGVSFTATSMQCNIFLNGNFIGIATLQQPVTIPGNTSMPMQVVAQFNSKDIGQFALSLLTGLFGGSKSNVFLIDGICKARINTWLPITIDYPVNETYTI